MTALSGSAPIPVVSGPQLGPCVETPHPTSPLVAQVMPIVVLAQLGPTGLVGGSMEYTSALQVAPAHSAQFLLPVSPQQPQE